MWLKMELKEAELQEERRIEIEDGVEGSRTTRRKKGLRSWKEQSYKKEERIEELKGAELQEERIEVGGERMYVDVTSDFST